MKRERWGTKLGLILAVAGNAIGLGNFLRFPVQVVKNGGGAFMLPYFIAFIVLGLPLMLVEWTVGRYGGTKGHSTTPGAFAAMVRSPVGAVFGSMGVFLPLLIEVYYIYIVSWSLGYTYFSARGDLLHMGSQEIRNFLSWFITPQPVHFGSFSFHIPPSYPFFLFTFALSMYVIYRGVSSGIEKLALVGMPVLFLLAVVLLVRVLTLGHPPGAEFSISEGLGFMWNPDFSALRSPSAWIAAAGQIFFTLSLGIGAIQCYASYVGKNEDIALSAFSTASVNEFAEVVLGGSIVVPAAIVFLGSTLSAGDLSSMNLGFVVLPMVFQKLVFGKFFATIWFLLLFLAGITSVVALAQPPVAFLEDEYNMSRPAAATVVALLIFIFTHPVIYGTGVLDELDFWMGTVGLVFFALLETVLFVFVFGVDKGWEELHRGAKIRVPGFFKYMQILLPAFLFVLFVWWVGAKWNTVFSLPRGPAAGWVLFARIEILIFLLAGVFLSLRSAKVKKEWNLAVQNDSATGGDGNGDNGV